MVEKECTICGVVKAVDQFYRAKTAKDGYRQYCKPCDNSRRRYANPEARREKARQQRIAEAGGIDPEATVDWGWFDRHHDWLRHAACGQADPKLFDDVANPGPALKICGTCPVTQLCTARVRPIANYYTGICGGNVWEDGNNIGH